MKRSADKQYNINGIGDPPKEEETKTNWKN